MIEDSLYNWLFHYNTYNGKWHAFRREDSNDYFNGFLKDVISDRDFNRCKHKAFNREKGR